jgi:hypothetical protein
VVGEWPLCELGREEVFRLWGLGRGEWSIGGQFLLGEEKFALAGAGRTAPELARDRLVFGLPIEATLEVVECDMRFIAPTPSPAGLSLESTATLFRRWWS